MKRILLFVLTVLPFIAIAQYCSWNGAYSAGISPNSKIRCLNIFVNIIYDVHPDTNNNFNNPDVYWPTITNPNLEGINTAAIPTYLLDWMDTVFISGQLHGTCTRLYGESSFDSLQIIGDFMVVNIKESTIWNLSGGFNQTLIPRAVLAFISEVGFHTINNHDEIGYYDVNNNDSVDYVNMFIRNITKNYGNLAPGSGYSPLAGEIKISGNLYSIETGTVQCVGVGNFCTNPTNIIVHEISHCLFGSNNFHTSGGNHRGSSDIMPFVNIQGGYGLMGAAESGLVCCNGYERWRMHWKHPQSIDYISARNATNTQSMTSDISIMDGDKTFLLRDFISYGDVVRIKLPYKSNCHASNQYIWLENHQVGYNNKLDFLQYSNTHICRPQGAAGIYAYYQIGRDTIEGSYYQVWDTCHRDNLKIIPAEGFFDYEFVEDTHRINCVNYDTQYLAIKRNLENPLCGGQDQEYHFNSQQADTVLYTIHEQETWRKIMGNQHDDQLPILGDNKDAFSTHTKINMGTNPSTCNAKTFYCTNKKSEIEIRPYVQERNEQTTYLTGLSIEMTPVQGTGNILVHIRWDDYNITNDTRWTGKIALKDTAILTTGNTITLAQNRTVAQPTRNPETGLFAGRTRWTCENGSYFRQDSASALILTENSSVIFENGSRYELAKGARVEIQAGCTLTVQPGAKIQLKGIVEVDSGGVLVLYDTAKMGNLSRLIVRPGGKLVVDGGTLTSACNDVMWQGIEVMGDRTKRQLAQYQGTIELRNGARIENALCAIRMGLCGDTVHFATAGGIISATNTTFKNNRQSVVINSYAYTAPSGVIADYNSIFSRCTFTIDNSNLFAANNTAFAEHVRLWDVKGVTFEGCDFSNTTTNQYWNGRGICAEDAGVSVSTCCPPQPTFVCKCPEADATYNYFSGFTTAVEVNTTGNPYAVRMDECRFSNNGIGVRINGNQFATVTRCQFNLDHHPDHTFGNIGLVLDGCTGYTVEENLFERTTYPSGPNLIESSIGIAVSNSGISANSVYRNVFNNLTKGITVVGNNGLKRMDGLQMTCNHFEGNKYDIYLESGATVCEHQGSSAKGADNEFHNTSVNISNFYNPEVWRISYYYYNGNTDLYPAHSTGVDLTTVSALNSCPSTLCDHNNGGGIYLPLSGFASQVSAYTAALSGTDDDGLEGANDYPSLQTLRQTLSDTYYAAVREIMSDTVLDLNELEQWHAAAQPIGDPYSLTETRFMLGYSEPFTADAEDAEMANYAEFHALKLALVNDNADNENNDNADNQDNNNSQNSQNSPMINWYSLTESQIAQLQTIAERKTGRASVMAKGVLCFFYGICYEDDLLGDDNADNQDNNMETRSAKVPQQEGETNLTVYPNPADDVLFIELRGGAGIANIGLYDLQGRAVGTRFIASATGTSATVNMRDIPAGVYVLRVTDTNGKEYHQKIVRK